VATTASAQNASYVKNLGATYHFDHKDENVVEQILKVLKLGDVVFDAIGIESSQKATATIVNRLGGGIIPVVSGPLPTGYDDVKAVFGMFVQSCPNEDFCLRRDAVNGLDPGLVDLDLGDAIWRKYLPEALSKGSFQAKPDPLIVKGGLEKVQEGIDILRKGVSAQKVVIEIAKEA